MKELDIIQLIEQESFINYCYRNNADDVTYWEKWLNENPSYERQVEEVKAVLLATPILASKKVIDHDFQLLKERIANQKKGKATRPTVKLWLRIGRIAAAVAIIFTGLFFYNRQHNSIAITNSASRWGNDIPPGKNAAILTLANGKTIALNDSKSGVIIKLSGITYNDGTAIEATGAESHKLSTISTPRGGQYNIELPDGTTVALNAASTLKFPASFTGLVNRTVELTGEGYFKVTKDKNHPFIVKSAGQQVEVLGTQFNINSYSDEPSVKTTLLEGSVRISQISTIQKNGSDISVNVLKPGQQSQLNDAGKFIIAEINTKEAVAWKEGKFIFKDESLGSIMRKISRWYNVDVIYQDIDPNEPFWGSISKFEKVSKVLEKLELTGGVHFKIEGKKIYVTR